MEKLLLVGLSNGMEKINALNSMFAITFFELMKLLFVLGVKVLCVIGKNEELKKCNLVVRLVTLTCLKLEQLKIHQ